MGEMVNWCGAEVQEMRDSPRRDLEVAAAILVAIVRHLFFNGRLMSGEMRDIIPASPHDTKFCLVGYIDLVSILMFRMVFAALMVSGRARWNYRALPIKEACRGMGRGGSLPHLHH